MTEEKRFKYYQMSHSVMDEITGKRFFGNQKTCDMMNDLNDRADRNAEELVPFISILKKYGIESVEKLDRILFERGVW